MQGSDLDILVRHYGLDDGKLRADLNRCLDKMRRGNTRESPGLSPDVLELAKQAWLLASVEHGLARLRSGHLLWALLADETLARRTREMSGQFARIQADALKRDMLGVTAEGIEADPRGGPRGRARHKHASAEGRGARPVHRGPDRQGPGRRDRPDPRP